MDDKPEHLKDAPPPPPRQPDPRLKGYIEEANDGDAT